MFPVTEKHEGDSVASKAPDKGDAGILETIRSSGAGDKEEAGKGS
jgi:hypothetical protein